MKFVTYETASSGPRAGLFKSGVIYDLNQCAAALGAALPNQIVGLLAMGRDGIAIARLIEANTSSLTGYPESDVKLGPVISAPPTIFLLAANYQSHITEGGGTPLDKSRATPLPFIKPTTSVIGTGDEIRTPTVSNKIDYEIEIAAVIGTRGHEIPLDLAMEHVAGYLVFNDISARELNTAIGRTNRPSDGFIDWLLGKWCDTFSAIGPFLVTSDEIHDPGRLEMSLWVNGELRQHSSAGEMIFTIPESVAFLSKFVTLEPGTLICMGTPGGVGATTSTYLRPGDLVVAEIEQLGRLENRVA